jgi:putative acetyltransferase
MLLSFCVMGRHSRPASILQKAITTFRWISLRRPEVRFFVARDAEGKAFATGAVVLHDDWAEIKRMWVEEAARGRGIARQILNVLMAEAGGAGLERLRLETGVANSAALALYEKTGFKRREPFADYRPDPLSVFMERQL